MNRFAIRGACPSLSSPMQTGDGLLVRLVLDKPCLSPARLISVLDAAARHGNGLVEITSRGSLQIRGLTASSAIALRNDIAPLDLPFGGLPILTGALAGIDGEEIADPLPLADAIGQALGPDLRSRLAPKTSIAIDGGGQLPIDGINADIRLAAMQSGQQIEWLIAVGGHAVSARPVCRVDEEKAVPAVIELLARIASKGATARGRDLEPDDLSDLGPAPHAKQPVSISRHVPVGIFALADHTLAVGIGLPFGASETDRLASLVATAVDAGAVAVRLAPGRALMFTGFDQHATSSFTRIASAVSFVTRPDDPRLAISACTGAPGCSSGEFDSRKLAGEISEAAAPLLDGSFTLHISGCTKRCADIAGPKLTIMGRNNGLQLLPELEPADRPPVALPSGRVPELFRHAAMACDRKRDAGEPVKTYLQRHGMNSFSIELADNH